MVRGLPGEEERGREEGGQKQESEIPAARRGQREKARRGRESRVRGREREGICFQKSPRFLWLF